jgi:monoamine oxidase
MLDTLIVGAGAAGLAAAAALHSAGQSVLVIEARATIGGRVRTDHSSGPVELGAEFIHGAHAATWSVLRAHSLNATPFPDAERPATSRICLVHDDAGQLIDAPAGFAARIDAQFSALGSYACSDDISVAEYARRIATPDNRKALHFALERMERFEGADTARLSATLLAAERHANQSGWDDFRMPAGYDSVIHALAHGLNIRTSTPAEHIDWNAQGVVVTTELGEALRARRAVIAAPHSQLQRERITFTPALPGWKRSAIAAIDMGPVLKIVLRFTRAVWPRFTFCTTEGTPQIFWEAIHSRTPVLLAYSGGPPARAISEAGEAAAIENALQQLERIFGPAARPAFDSGALVNWPVEPFVEGGYTYPTLGSAGAREALARPVDGVLHFAGEATAMNGHYATVHGAIESGWRAAADILERTRGIH